MRFDVLTLFPGMLRGALSEGMLRIAQEKGLLEVHLHDIRKYTEDKHGKVDDRPYGGGPGMVLCCQPIFSAFEAVTAGATQPFRRILLTPQGRHFDQAVARELSAEERVVLICGRYEGFDERIRSGLQFEELSIGDYILSGGEMAALVVIEATARLIEGVLGDAESAQHESFSRDLLDYPQYTRPAVFRDMAVPEVLLSGNHEAIRCWREEMALRRTAERRKDLLGRATP